MEPPETQYAKTPDGLHIAYQVVGGGPLDLVLVSDWFSSVDGRWDHPWHAELLRKLAAFSRLIMFDKRGAGLSDPIPLGALPTLETWTDDLKAVLEAVGDSRAALVGASYGGLVSMLFAATYPDRVSALVLINTYSRLMRAADYPAGWPEEVLEPFLPHFAGLHRGPSEDPAVPTALRNNARYAHASQRYWGQSGSPGTRAVVIPMLWRTDIRDVLPAIRVPTLVLHRSGNRFLRVGHAEYLAERIPGARLLVLPGDDHYIETGEIDGLVSEIQEFLTGVRPTPEPDRALATVLFTDIVSSTEHATRLGDRKWTQLLDQHDAIIASELDRHRGRRVNPTGDGILASFDGPARAVRCARAIVEAVRPLGIEVRAGLHTGEVELRGEDIGGIAVHIGQRVSALARPGEVLVSRTVTDLVAGSGLEFTERGEQELKGVPGKWSVYAVKT